MFICTVQYLFTKLYNLKMRKSIKSTKYFLRRYDDGMQQKMWNQLNFIHSVKFPFTRKSKYFWYNLKIYE